MTISSTTPSLEVAEFLTHHPTLVPLVDAARQALRPYFPDTPLLLEIFEDPEFADPPKLHLVVVPTIDPSDAVSRYEQFQRAWWSAIAPRIQTQFAIVLEYR
jgi:hypothetical protein